jgi:transcription-repair coupling factor (superfamily II helicase)
MENNRLNHQLIVSITPYFLEKSGVWFTENLEQILQSQKTQAFFQDNTLYIEAGQKVSVSEMLRKLDEMGYERVFEVRDPGEITVRGGVVDLFPINSKNAVRLDFLGNTLESISMLDIAVADEEKARDILKKRLKSQKIFSDLKDLKPGEFLVHLDHGVGKFTGKETLGEHEYYILEYAARDKLYVPVGLEQKLSRYVGFVDPQVARLGSLIWQKTKRKVKEEVEKMAKDLLALYSKKETATRKPYQFDETMERQLEDGFIYEETPDQLKVLEDIKSDFSLEKPMDRIVCGDVGFGKTEIALRASFMAAVNNYQSAIICPTTILASQHFEMFQKRLKEFPIKVAVLSRLQTKHDQEKTLKEIAEGKIDIVIGTHRLLSNDITFKNLQLLIIDDEQRFGVKQKEKLRTKNPAIDLLSLSATPIPRTVYLALASFKEISLMQTPPRARQPVDTFVLPFNEKQIQAAIVSELQRGGQVYFLHNRVASIHLAKEKLQKLVPDANISAIHGRLPEKQMIQIIADFQNKKTNVLLATTIIENGIDLPNVNTIIVEDASRLGLSQAYQLKGRVGRSHIKGYAYFFYPPNIPALAKQRLDALKEAQELGSGYRIAMKDLELRGAGNVLGKEQSGAINKIGLNLYSQMLSEAVEKLRGY